MVSHSSWSPLIGRPSWCFDPASFPNRLGIHYNSAFGLPKGQFRGRQDPTRKCRGNCMLVATWRKMGNHWCSLQEGDLIIVLPSHSEELGRHPLAGGAAAQWDWATAIAEGSLIARRVLEMQRSLSKAVSIIEQRHRRWEALGLLLHESATLEISVSFPWASNDGYTDFAYRMH